MGYIINGLLLQGKAILEASLLYISLYLFGVYMDYLVLGISTLRFMFFIYIICYILEEDFTLDGISYITTKWIQILGDLVTPVAVFAITTSIIVSIIDVKITGFIEFLLAITILLQLAVIAVSIVYLLKHSVQIIGAYIRKWTQGH